MKKMIKKLSAALMMGAVLWQGGLVEAGIPSDKYPLQTYAYWKFYCDGSGYVDPGDLVIVEKVNGTKAYGSYPTSKGRVYRWFNLKDLIYDSGFANYEGVANQSSPVYRQPTGTATIGTVAKGQVWVYSEYNGRKQIVYKLSNNSGYKMGWVASGVVTKKAASTPNPPVAPSVATNGFIYPVDNANFGYRQWGAYYASKGYHVALDLYSNSYTINSQSQTNAKVKSIANGKVADCGNNSANGKYVVIEHNINGKKIYSFYAHLNSYNVTKGNTISKGQVVGNLGKTGSASGNIYHLHFSIVDTLKPGSYYGYISAACNGKNKVKDSKSGVTFYNPKYIIDTGIVP